MRLLECIKLRAVQVELNSKSRLLWRYTTLSSALHILRTGSLTLLPPESWEDKNDVHFLAIYKKRMRLKSLHAICVSTVPQTFHHWYVFARGPEGVCLTFKKKMLLAAFDAVEGMQHGSVLYKSSDEAKFSATLQNLPYLKHQRYSDEGEYRAFVSSKVALSKPPTVAITSDMIDRITLSPWLHTSLKDSIEQTIQSIPTMTSVKVYRSSLIEFSGWRSIAENCPHQV